MKNYISIKGANSQYYHLNVLQIICVFTPAVKELAIDQTFSKPLTRIIMSDGVTYHTETSQEELFKKITEAQNYEQQP